ncbi:hypothetical protein CLHUN_05760 [Ruminiclostridium hungatei]|uniref:Uncharacterized protein n=1 Tax=Ruminiclostridium hungatei TaxID=48256 RepID=A0A1V4SP26_RUMHU|nr:hypothetical protein [Ruminiclostridium hungatei]OPX45639.1 hypothetical protein CLHUN_05760 [Ruminiclostridium hungatei]
MKKIILSLAMFAISMALLITVIIPLAEHGKENGQKVETQMDTIDTKINSLSTAIAR